MILQLRFSNSGCKPDSRFAFWLVHRTPPLPTTQRICHEFATSAGRLLIIGKVLCSGRIPQEGSNRVLRRPGYLTGTAVGQIGDLAGAGCGNSGFDWRVGLFTGLDAIEEILHVVDGAVTEAVCPDDWIVLGRHAFVIDAKAAAVELQGCVRAAELEAAVVDRGGHHALIDHIEAGIAESCLNGVGAIPL